MRTRNTVLTISCPFGGDDDCPNELTVEVHPATPPCREDSSAAFVEAVSGCPHVEGVYDDDRLWAAVEDALVDLAERAVGGREET